MKHDKFPVSRLLFEIVDRIGVPQYARGTGPACQIPSPPLSTTLRLGSIDLNDLLQLTEVVEADACGIFNEFVWMFIGPEEPAGGHPGHWMIENGQIPLGGRWAFRNEDCVERVGAIFLRACLQTGFEGSHTPKELLVTTEDGTFGFRNGWIVSPTPVMEQPYAAGLDWQKIFDRPGSMGRCRTRAFNRLWLEAHRHKDREALLLALSILYWRANRARDVVNMLYPVDS